MAVSIPLINGIRPEWSSIQIKANNAIYVGVVGIDYKSPLKPSKVYGTNPRPIGRTIGQLEPDGSMEMLADEAKSLVEALGPGFKLVPFDIEVQYQMGDGSIQTDQLIGCRIVDIETSHSQGPDALTKKIPLDVMKVLYNGVEELPDQYNQGAPTA